MTSSGRLDLVIYRAWIRLELHIALADFIVLSIAILLVKRSEISARDTALFRVLAVLSGGVVLAIVVALLFADNLNPHAEFELLTIAFFLGRSLWKWHEARVKKTEPV